MGKSRRQKEREAQLIAQASAEIAAEEEAAARRQQALGIIACVVCLVILFAIAFNTGEHDQEGTTDTSPAEDRF